MKKSNIKTIIVSILFTAIAVSSFAGCGCDNKSASPTATPDEASATLDEASYVAETTAAVLDSTEKAIVNQGLSVNDKGEVVDADGKKVKTTSDGKVKVTTSDGRTVEVSTAKVKETQQKSSAAASSQNVSGQQSSSTGSKQGGGSQQSSANTSQTKSGGERAQQTTTPKQQTTTPKQQQQPATQKPTSAPTPTTPRKSESTTPAPTQPKPTTDPHAGKTWHDAVYRVVKHPSETKQVKVVDREAYTYEEPVYETKRIAKCKDCGIDISKLGSDEERIAHANMHIDAGGDGGWYSTTEQVQVGTETITVPEQSHMETVVVKEAWTERILVRETGWY